jgi:hypothetical protein
LTTWVAFLVVVPDANSVLAQYLKLLQKKIFLCRPFKPLNGLAVPHEALSTPIILLPPPPANPREKAPAFVPNKLSPHTHTNYLLAAEREKK